jgi:hypothetical protein
MSRPANSQIKRHLQATFPAVKFSVRSGRGTGASWTHIGWTDGPTDGRVTEALAAFGVVAGHMDMSDYFEGERISTSRDISEANGDVVARVLLAPKAVPARSLWSRNVRIDGRGWVDLHQIVWCAAANRENAERSRFEAHLWLDAVTLDRTEALRSTCYERLATPADEEENTEHEQRSAAHSS